MFYPMLCKSRSTALAMVLFEPYPRYMRSSEGLQGMIQRCKEEQVSWWDPEQEAGVLQAKT